MRVGVLVMVAWLVGGGVATPAPEAAQAEQTRWPPLQGHGTGGLRRVESGLSVVPYSDGPDQLNLSRFRPH